MQDSDFYYVLFTFLANTHGLFLYNKKDVNILNLFQSTLRKYNRKANKIWVDKGSKICSNSLKNDYKTMMLLRIQHIMKKNLLLLKDLLVP